MKSLFSLFLVSLHLSLQLVVGVVNNDVSQVFDISTSIVHYTADIKATQVEKEYTLIFPTAWATHLAILSATVKGKDLIYDTTKHGNYTSYRFELEDPNPTFKFKAVFTSLLVPFPSEISQSEQQLVLFESTHYFFSPYQTISQKSVFKLASSSIESYTKISPHSVRGSAIHFGPFSNIAPFTYSKLSIHYVNNFPFAKFSSLTKEIEVSHWGNIAVEEIYELKHAGAALKGGFSRFDYQMKRMQQSPSFRTLTAYLPSQASNIYYRDQIGNISTSDIHIGANGNLELEIQTRFPMFGGWQTQFYIGYSIPTELALFHSDSHYVLKFDFFTIFRDVWIEDMEIKVILPEGCTNIQVNVPYRVERSQSTRYTFLDSHLNGGRSVIILKTSNIVEEHDQKVIVTYDFTQSRMIVEPLMLITAFFALFFTCTLLSRATSLVSANSRTR